MPPTSENRPTNKTITGTVLRCGVVWCTELYYAILSCDVMYSTIQYSTVVYYAVMYRALIWCKHSWLQCSTVPKWTMLYWAVLSCGVTLYGVLPYPILFYPIIFFIPFIKNKTFIKQAIKCTSQLKWVQFIHPLTFSSLSHVFFCYLADRKVSLMSTTQVLNWIILNWIELKLLEAKWKMLNCTCWNM